MLVPQGLETPQRLKIGENTKKLAISDYFLGPKFYLHGSPPPFSQSVIYVELRIAKSAHLVSQATKDFDSLIRKDFVFY